MLNLSKYQYYYLLYLNFLYSKRIMKGTYGQLIKQKNQGQISPKLKSKQIVVEDVQKCIGVIESFMTENSTAATLSNAIMINKKIGYTAYRALYDKNHDKKLSCVKANLILDHTSEKPLKFRINIKKNILFNINTNKQPDVHFDLVRFQLQQQIPVNTFPNVNLNLDSSDNHKYQIHVIGFPAVEKDINKFKLHVVKCNAVLKDNIVTYDQDQNWKLGMSGSPILLYNQKGNSLELIGIHQGFLSDSRQKKGTQITEQILSHKNIIFPLIQPKKQPIYCKTKSIIQTILNLNKIQDLYGSSPNY